MAAANEFQLQIRTPARTVIDARVTEVVLPAHDGERGVLPGHERFVGLLGTGALKLVREGDDFWFVISSGVYEVQGAKIVVLTEYAQDAREVNVES